MHLFFQFSPHIKYLWGKWRKLYLKLDWSLVIFTAVISSPPTSKEIINEIEFLLQHIKKNHQEFGSECQNWLLHTQSYWLKFPLCFTIYLQNTIKSSVSSSLLFSSPVEMPCRVATLFSSSPRMSWRRNNLFIKFMPF